MKDIQNRKEEYKSEAGIKGQWMLNGQKSATIVWNTSLEVQSDLDLFCLLFHLRLLKLLEPVIKNLRGIV